MTATVKDLAERGQAIRSAQLAHQDAMRQVSVQLGTARRTAAEQATPAPPEQPQP